MGLPKGDIEKVPPNLRLPEYYARIVDWHSSNKDRIHEKMKGRGSKDPYIQCYFELVKALPSAASAKDSDIAFACWEVIAGLMEWAYHEEDSHGVKTAAYAHYILNKYFDGFSGPKTRKALESSSMYPELSMSGCMTKHKSA